MLARYIPRLPVSRLAPRVLPSFSTPSLFRRGFKGVPSSVDAADDDGEVAYDGPAFTTENGATDDAFGYGSTDDLFDSSQRSAAEVDADPSNRTFTYLITGSAAFTMACIGRNAVHRFVAYMSASADVLAMASMEVELQGIAEGTSLTVKWRGKPVFIRHRNAKEIEAARADDKVTLRDPQTDGERFEQAKWAVLIGVCTHLGCVPTTNAGDWNGWFCPCHGSHYDTSGRIRKGPAPLNLEVPQYKFLSDDKILLG